MGISKLRNGAFATLKQQGPAGRKNIKIATKIVAVQYIFFPYALPLASAGVGGYIYILYACYTRSWYIGYLTYASTTKTTRMLNNFMLTVLASHFHNFSLLAIFFPRQSLGVAIWLSLKSVGGSRWADVEIDPHSERICSSKPHSLYPSRVWNCPKVNVCNCGTLQM